ncbi:ASFV G ACD 01990 [African swine fever virus]|uniref:ACD_01990 n=1 Tax=African swine fever virus TaxID=10497 RepID=A0A2X0RU37_ASF|nr:hypothetical protein IM014_gp003 [African swine fever virus]YP_009927289.1 hypothetical protein IM014_gp201 [African swine fever virus]AXZ95932.1 ACD_01990 [African swine fever virus]AXZ96215.1 ACD_01990 [African swine fever virus]AYW34131.1 ASFV_G_ACD_01990 [African swine fever virus]AZP54124.1 ASFV-G-ACD-01990 [African swine fever virus]AZP54304.1 ASFV-G-ACD-01990 [African swine fever virus]
MNIYLVWFLYILLGNLILAVIYCVIDEVVCDNIHIKKNVAAPEMPRRF